MIAPRQITIMAHAKPNRSSVVQENIGLSNQNNNNNKNIKKKRLQKKKNDNGLSSGADGAFKLNAKAQEFVPKSVPLTGLPVSGDFVPCFQNGEGTGGEADKCIAKPASPCTNNNDVLTEQLQNKIIKQIEYQLSDMSLLSNQNLEKQIHNDTEGFVPISLVSSTKKLKPISTSNQNLLAEALHASTKLDVSSDGTRVRRKNPFTQKAKDELQARIVVAENLPNDHSHQNLEKIFNVAGGHVKTIRVCHPQEASSQGKGDCVISTKLHALVEFENIESAEKAVEKLNVYKKSGKSLLRLKMMTKRSPKSVLKSGNSVFDKYLDDDEEEDYSPVQRKTEPFVVDNNAECIATSSKNVTNTKVGAKQTTKIPRMPDGTKGFDMGRGRQTTISV